MATEVLVRAEMEDLETEGQEKEDMEMVVEETAVRVRVDLVTVVGETEA